MPDGQVIAVKIRPSINSLHCAIIFSLTAKETSPIWND